jgi:hypothetical protein
MRCHPGQIRIFRNSLLSEDEFASVFEADTRLDRNLCNEALLESPTDPLPRDSYLFDLGNGFEVSVPLPLEVEDTFKRDARGVIPPEGLVRIATEMQVDMTGYRVDGGPHPVYSMGAPKQVDIRLLGSIPVTIVELGVVSSDWRPI